MKPTEVLEREHQVIEQVSPVYRSADGIALPPDREILRHLEFIGFQCPECEPPEWPV